MSGLRAIAPSLILRILFTNFDTIKKLEKKNYCTIDSKWFKFYSSRYILVRNNFMRLSQFQSAAMIRSTHYNHLHDVEKAHWFMIRSYWKCQPLFILNTRLVSWRDKHVDSKNLAVAYLQKVFLLLLTKSTIYRVDKKLFYFFIGWNQSEQWEAQKS